VAEIVRLYGLRPWVEQSYKQTKYALGWHEYQVRSDLAIRRHWALVCCAFAFCWYNARQQRPALAPTAGTVRSSPAPAPRPPVPVPVPVPAPAPAPLHEAGRGENQRDAGAGAAPALLAGGAPGGTGVVGAVDHAVALLARVVKRAPGARSAQVA
jgi:hypothetical protein